MVNQFKGNFNKIIISLGVFVSLFLFPTSVYALSIAIPFYVVLVGIIRLVISFLVVFVLLSAIVFSAKALFEYIEKHSISEDIKNSLILSSAFVFSVVFIGTILDRIFYFLHDVLFSYLGYSWREFFTWFLSFIITLVPAFGFIKRKIKISEKIYYYVLYSMFALALLIWFFILIFMKKDYGMVSVWGMDL